MNYKEPVKKGWLDHYQHLNEAYYIVAFSNATWALQCNLGIGTVYFNKTGRALYTVESHISYIKEVRAPATLNIKIMVLDFRERKLWLGHELRVANTLRATFECLLIHFDTGSKQAINFGDETQTLLGLHKEKRLPGWVGKSISIDRRQS